MDRNRNNRIVIITCCIVLALLSCMQLIQQDDDEEAFSNATIKYGAVGQDVRELQGRLKFLGFYNGDIDGDFGYATLRSLKWFQSEFGLTVDGVAGAKTKLKLWEATRHWKPGPEYFGQTTWDGGGGGGGNQAAGNASIPSSNHLGFSAQELKMMANAVYGEARGEPYEGQVAVAAVILNRVKSASFPNTPTGVIFQPGAFTAVDDGQIWLEPNDSARRAVQDAINGWDPTGGCIYYFNPVTATSKWIWSRPQVKRIGKHIFCM